MTPYDAHPRAGLKLMAALSALLFVTLILDLAAAGATRVLLTATLTAGMLLLTAGLAVELVLTRRAAAEPAADRRLYSSG
jgi:hypothetical protein